MSLQIEAQVMWLIYWPHPSRVNIEADMLIVRNNYKRFAERMQQKIGIVLPDFADEFADLMAKKHESILRTATASKRLDLMRWTSDRFCNDRYDEPGFGYKYEPHQRLVY